MGEENSTTDARLSKALDHLRSILIEGETLDAWAVQRRLFALTKRRMIVAATSGRFIALSRGFFGGFEIRDIRWQDVRDASVRVGVFGADLTIAASGMADLATSTGTPNDWTFRGLRKEQAQHVYRLAQTHEQSWREKRRVRELEELRARSGGVQVNAGHTAPPSAAGANDSVARLQQAKQMLDAKLITDSEYEAIKARVIGGL